MSPAQLSELFSGKANIGPKVAKKISAALAKHGINVTPGHILDGLTQDNWELIPKSDYGIERGGDNFTYQGPLDLTDKIPVLASIPAGDPVEWIDDMPVGIADEYVDRGGISGSGVFAIRANGDSMEPRMHHGDILIIDPERTFRTYRGGRIGVVRHENGGYQIRKIHLSQDGLHYILEPLSNSYDPTTVKVGSIHIYKIMELRSRGEADF